MVKKHIFLSLFFLSIVATAQAPTKLFDVRNGNGIVDNGTAQPVATYVAYKDAAAKQAVIDALCDVGNYDALDPATRPTKQAFANREITNWLRERVRESRQRTEQKKLVNPDISDLP